MHLFAIAFNQYSKSIPHYAKTFPRPSKYFNKALSVNAFNKLGKNFNNVTETLNYLKHSFNNQQNFTDVQIRKYNRDIR